VGQYKSCHAQKVGISELKSCCAYVWLVTIVLLDVFKLKIQEVELLTHASVLFHDVQAYHQTKLVQNLYIDIVGHKPSQLLWNVAEDVQLSVALKHSVQTFSESQYHVFNSSHCSTVSKTESVNLFVATGGIGAAL